MNILELKRMTALVVLIGLITAQFAFPYTAAFAEDETATDSSEVQESSQSSKSSESDSGDSSLSDDTDEGNSDDEGVDNSSSIDSDSEADSETSKSVDEKNISNDETSKETVDAENSNDIEENISEIETSETIETEEDTTGTAEDLGNSEQTESSNSTTTSGFTSTTTSVTANTDVQHSTTSAETEDLTDTATTSATDTLASSTDSIAATSTDTLTGTTTDTLASTTASTTPETATSTPVIVSGTALALANILNLVNTNFINSNGVFLFSNFFDTIAGSLDFRNFGDSVASGTCPTAPCTSGEGVAVNVSNDASIDNAVMIQASSGENVIDGAGHATIETGDAYAGLNLINVANTTVQDSEYLIVTLNAFKDLNGDVVFPSLSNFFNSLAGGSVAPSDISITGEAVVDNTVDVHANSGDNSVETANGGEIVTGDSHATANVFNELNTTLAGDKSVSILFRVHGNWAGQIFGAPPGLSWIEGEDGSIYLFDTPDGMADSGPGNGGSITSSSTGHIRNNVSVTALSGENQVTNAETALISTGNALAGANIVNVANANVISRNWILAVINIFGDFTGNIAFGRPDMWIGEQIETPSQIKNESELTYKLTLINNGDSKATGIVLTDEYDTDHIDILESSLEYTTDDEGKLKWNIPEMNPGDATEITYKARIKNAKEGTEITNHVSVIQNEPDNNTIDNSDTATVITDKRKKRTKKEKEITPEPASQTISVAHLSAERMTVYATSTIPGSVAQKLLIKNKGTQDIVDVVLFDRMYDPNGVLLQNETWDLGTILAGEEIDIGYTVEFGDSAQSGLYTFSTEIRGTSTQNVLFTDNGSILVARPASILIPEIPEAEEFNGTSTIASLIEKKQPPEADSGMVNMALADTGNMAAVGNASSQYPFLASLLPVIVGLLVLVRARQTFV